MDLHRQFKQTLKKYLDGVNLDEKAIPFMPSVLKSIGMEAPYKFHHFGPRVNTVNHNQMLFVLDLTDSYDNLVMLLRVLDLPNKSIDILCSTEAADISIKINAHAVNNLMTQFKKYINTLPAHELSAYQEQSSVYIEIDELDKAKTRASHLLEAIDLEDKQFKIILEELGTITFSSTLANYLNDSLQLVKTNKALRSILKKLPSSAPYAQALSELIGYLDVVEQLNHRTIAQEFYLFFTEVVPNTLNRLNIDLKRSPIFGDFLAEKAGISRSVSSRPLKKENLISISIEFTSLSSHHMPQLYRYLHQFDPTIAYERTRTILQNGIPLSRYVKFVIPFTIIQKELFPLFLTWVLQMRQRDPERFEKYQVKEEVDNRSMQMG